MCVHARCMMYDYSGLSLFLFIFLFLVLFFFCFFFFSVATDSAISHAVGLVDALDYEFKSVGFTFGVNFHPVLEVGLHVSRDSLDTILQFGFSLGVGTPVDALVRARS